MPESPFEKPFAINSKKPKSDLASNIPEVNSIVSHEGKRALRG